MHYLYVISSINKKWIYIGSTNDLKSRFAQHQRGEVKSTKAYKPFKLLYYEAYLKKADALSREYKLKHHSQTRELLYKQLTKSIKSGAIV